MGGYRFSAQSLTVTYTQVCSEIDCKASGNGQQLARRVGFRFCELIEDHYFLRTKTVSTFKGNSLPSKEILCNKNFELVGSCFCLGLFPVLRLIRRLLRQPQLR